MTPKCADLVTQEMIETYRRDGAVCVPGAVSKAWTKKLKDQFEEIRKKGVEDLPGVVLMENGDGRVGFGFACRVDPVYQDWTWNSGVAELVAKVIESETARFWFDALFYKNGVEPRTATPWHHDITSFSFKGNKIPSLWIALTDVDEDSAPLVTLPGSHKEQDVQYRPPPCDPNIPLPPKHVERDGLEKRVNAIPEQLKVWTVKEGDAIILHPWLVHASYPHGKEDSPRLGFSTRWLGDDTVFAPTGLSEKDALLSMYEDPIKVGEPPRGPAYPEIYPASPTPEADQQALADIARRAAANSATDLPPA